MQSLQRLVLSISDPLRKGKWMMVQQQISKEYDQLKAIQNELTELAMGMANAPLQALRRNLAPAETETRDPGAFFRADPDVWSPPSYRDPDVFGPPIDRSMAQVRPQRPNTNNGRKVDPRRTAPTKNSAKDTKNAPKKGASTLNSARGINKDSNRRTTDSTHNKENNKDEDAKEEDPPEEEKRFEAANHMEGDLVDVLGKSMVDVGWDDKRDILIRYIDFLQNAIFYRKIRTSIGTISLICTKRNACLRKRLCCPCGCLTISK